MNAPWRHLWMAGLWLAMVSAVPVRAADSFSSVYISEFLADNRQGLRDEDGERSSWIELYNGGTTTVDLTGWFLTDSATNRTLWRFPGVWLLPDKYLIVFASGKARTNNLAYLHANFRLAPQGGYIALVNPARSVVSEFAPAYPRQAADVSFGRLRSEPRSLGSFQKPTPGKPNTTSGRGFAPEVTFSRSGGTFTSPFHLQLRPPSAGAAIRYTLDGSLPTSNSLVYREPLLITNTAHVRARAYQDGLLPGPPHSEAYLLIHTNLLGFTSSLPLLIMHTFGRDVPVSSRASFVHLSFFEPINGRTSLTNPPTLTTRGSFHVRGSSSSGMPQSSYAVEFLDEFNDEERRAPLGLPADAEWVLYAPNGYEPVMIHNPFVHQLSRDMGRYSPRTRFLEAYLATHPGPVRAADYQGIYVLEEKIKIAKQRVDIDRLGPTDLQPPEVTGGYLLKVDRVGPGEAGFYAGGVSLVHVDPKESVINLPQRVAQQQYLETFLNNFERSLRGSKRLDPVQGYRAYIDVDSWIDFHVLEVLSGNVDSLVLSTYFHKPREGKIVFGPHWDFDRALGSTDGRDDNPRQWNTGRFFDAPWWSRLFDDPDFWQRWVDRWQELRRTHFDLLNLNDLIDSLADELREAQPRQVKRWGLHPRGGSYQSEIDLMKSWLSNRVRYIDRQLVQPPAFGREGGRVAPGFTLTLTVPPSTAIHYTLDGSDPRLPQGAVSPKALRYAGPIQVQTNVVITARAHNPSREQTDGPPTSTPWSAPVSAKFELATP